MKKITYILFFLLIAAGSVKVTAQSVTYRITDDDPYDIKNFSLAIDPLFCDINAQNAFSAGWGLRADYLLGKSLQFNFDFRTAYATTGYNPDNENNRNFFYTEGGLGIVLSHKEKRKNVAIVLSSTQSGNTRTTISIAGGVPATIRKMVMFHGGVYSMTNAIKFSNLSDSLTYFENGSDKLMLKDTAISNHTSGSTENGYGGVASQAIFAGFNFKRIVQLYVDVDGWGTRSNRRYTDFFIDGIFSPVLTLKNFTTNNKEYKVTSKDKRLFGWRMGWIYRDPYNQGVSLRFEFGQRPDLMLASNTKMTGFFCMFTWGMYIPLKVDRKSVV